MAINRPLLAAALTVGAGLYGSPPAWSREAASPSACQAAAAKPAIVDGRSALAASPDDLENSFKLADAWSDAGCFNEAAQVLQSAQGAHPGNKELETRLRVAYSLVGEEHFFDNLDRATSEARLKRQSFRCTNLADLDACNDALRLKPDDPALLVAQGDALLRAKRPADAANRYRLAAVIAPDQRDITAKLAAAEGQLQDSPAGSALAPAATAAPGSAPASASTSASGTAPASGAAPAQGSAPAANLAAAPAVDRQVRMPTAAVPGELSPAPADTAPLRTANVGATKVHRYSNAAPEAQSH